MGDGVVSVWRGDYSIEAKDSWRVDYNNEFGPLICGPNSLSTIEDYP